MKTLRKLKINSEKIIKNVDLLRLRGGYDQLCCTCILEDPPYTPQVNMVADGPWQCSYWCGYANPDWTGWWRC